MASVNKVILIGRLGRDPELRYTKESTAITNLSLATTEYDNSVEWHSVSVWGKTAESCAKYLSKGRQVYVEGSLKTRKWKDKDGNWKDSTFVNASSVKFLGQSDSNNQGQTNGDTPSKPMSKPEFNDDIPF